MTLLTIGSNELNKKMEQADKEIESIKNKINLTEKDVIKKLNLIKNEEAYANELLNQVGLLIESGSYDKDRSKQLFNNIEGMYGEFEQFGSTVHPKFIRTPRNLFNIITTNGVLFRANAIAYVNNLVNLEARYPLMGNGAKGKGIYFEEFKDNEISLLIEMDRNNLLGDTHFNTIEIDPCLIGSFDITDLIITEMYASEPIKINKENITRVGRSRIILDRKYELQSIEFRIKLNYKNELGLHPFGLQSLQFLNADFKTSSHIVFPINKRENIEFVENSVEVKNVLGALESTLSYHGIQLYFESVNGVLKNEIELSEEDIILPFSRNTKTIYAYVPLSSSVSSVEFKRIKTR